ncbi:GNAT family N-acetyltransferase [Chitinophaga lutea]|uniref:GNAT family N-acetyltransferase n=1 Tax=Chitinophaga lutea TaxID=2488634 RepID=A0A3N4PKI3_9BACT|nr:GNAT family N-acetyltransferase [Chitinophaga lutea]RPE08048.1 GNAT family N-acetyltransferase [Chitinophaga lutea]
MDIQLVRIGPADVGALQELAGRTFIDAFGGANTAEDMDSYLKTALSETKLREELTNPDSEFYFALVDHVPAGYLKINFAAAQTDLRDEAGIEIERIYVLQQYHGQRVAPALIGKALEIATERKAAYIWLGVWEENARAIRFYEKNGFVPFGTHVFKLGSDEQTDVLMKKVMRE